MLASVRAALDQGDTLVRGHKRKIVVLGVLASAAFAGSLWALYRRKRQRKRSSLSSSNSRNGRQNSSRQMYMSSSSTTASTVVGASGDRQIPLSHGQNTLICAGVESLNESIKNWEQAINISVLKNETSSNQLVERLEILLDKAQALRDEFARFLVSYNCTVPRSSVFRQAAAGEVRFAGTLPESSSMVSIRKTMSILSDDSFMSALDDFPVPSFPEIDVLDRPPLAIPVERLVAYQCGLKEVRAGNVAYRVCRTDALRCSSDEDFLAKLYCIRKSFDIIFSDSSMRDWLTFQGRELLASILRRSNKDPGTFAEAYDRLLEFVSDSANHQRIEQELQARQVPLVSFYDVLFDFVLLDAFDDLSRPPASVLAVAQNRFLTASFKESDPALDPPLLQTLQTVVWSVLKAKRARLRVADGFISKFYDVSEQVSPTLAWGFLGTDVELRELCYYFKDQIYSFLTDIFSFDRVDYTDFDSLAEDIWLICKGRVGLTVERLEAEPVLEDDGDDGIVEF